MFGGKAYQARYNGSTVFANLVSSLNTTPFGTTTAEERNPLTGSIVIPDPISSIQSQYAFTLSARDSASGTSTFQVNPPNNNIPEPSTYVLASLGMIGLWFARRRAPRRTA